VVDAQDEHRFPAKLNRHFQRFLGQIWTLRQDKGSTLKSLSQSTANQVSFIAAPVSVAINRPQ